MIHDGVFGVENVSAMEMDPEPSSGAPAIYPVALRETAEDLLNINVLPTGQTILDQQINHFYRWAETKLHLPGGQYLASAKIDPVTHPVSIRAEENQQTLALFKKTFSSFLWTGIECSNPESHDGQRWDQLELTGFYDPDHRDRQIDCLMSLGIQNVRLGMPNHIMVEQNSWEPFTQMLQDFKAKHIKVSLDLQHFGLPSTFRNADNPMESLYLNPEWPQHFVQFALTSVKEYLPHLEAITIINEPLITNRFSSSWWNEAMPGNFSDPLFNHYFIKRALLIAEAAVETRYGIEAYLQEINHRILFIHNESCEYQPDDVQFNQYQRFLTSDLILGQDWLLEDDFESSEMFKWLVRQYVRQESLSDDYTKLVTALEGIRRFHHAFEKRFGKTMKADTVFGVDYYLGCETVKPGFQYELSKTDVSAYEEEVASGKRRGLTRICIDYWNRYQLPILHTETNFFDHGSEDWGTKQLMELAQLPKFGIPVLGFTWYSLMDQFNWDDALKGSPKDIRLHPVGLISWPDYQPRAFTKTVLKDLITALSSETHSAD